MSYVPPGFSKLTSFLHLEEAEKYIEFLQKAFGAEVRMSHKVDGKLAHGEVVIEGTVVEISESRPQWPATISAFHLFVQDVDGAHQKALDAGATELQAPADQPYGERSSAIKDPWGNIWYPARVIDMEVRTKTD